MFIIFVTDRGRPLSRDQVAAIRIPNSSASLSCYAWMNSYFNLVGDIIPNKDEVHLEAIEIKEIYQEYVEVFFKIYPIIYIYCNYYNY